MLCCVMLCYVMLCDVMLCYVMLCYVMLCYVMLCNVMLCYVMLCYVILSFVMLIFVMLCYVSLSYLMLCCVMLCYVILCYTSWAPRRCPGLFHNFIVKKSCADWYKGQRQKKLCRPWNWSWVGQGYQPIIKARWNEKCQINIRKIAQKQIPPLDWVHPVGPGLG